MYQFVLSEWVKTEVEIKSSEVLWVDCSESACDVIISWSTTVGYEIRKIIFSLYSTELNHDSWHTFLFKTRWILTVWHLPWKEILFGGEKVMMQWGFQVPPGILNPIWYARDAIWSICWEWCCASLGSNECYTDRILTSLSTC